MLYQQVRQKGEIKDYATAPATYIFNKGCRHFTVQTSRVTY